MNDRLPFNLFHAQQLGQVKDYLEGQSFGFWLGFVLAMSFLLLLTTSPSSTSHADKWKSRIERWTAYFSLCAIIGSVVWLCFSRGWPAGSLLAFFAIMTILAVALKGRWLPWRWWSWFELVPPRCDMCHKRFRNRDSLRATMADSGYRGMRIYSHQGKFTFCEKVCEDCWGMHENVVALMEKERFQREDEQRINWDQEQRPRFAEWLKKAPLFPYTVDEFTPCTIIKQDVHGSTQKLWLSGAISRDEQKLLQLSSIDEILDLRVLPDAISSRYLDVYQLHQGVNPEFSFWASASFYMFESGQIAILWSKTKTLFE